MNKKNQKGIFVKSFFWRFFERIGAQGVTLIVSIVLARILDPEVYGTVALITVFTIILQVFVDSGLGNALIQKKDADELDFSSVFYFNIVLCVVLYVLVFFAAPLIAWFYKNDTLVPLIRVVSLILIISGVKNVQHAYVARNMLFRRFFFATLGGTIGAAVIGIYLARKGYGVWALIAQDLFNQTIDTIILWLTVKWRPKRMFSWERLKSLLSYGWKLLVSKLLDTVYTEFRSLVIGRIYSASDLAFYNRGKQFPSVFVTNINTSIESVLFPVLSNEQDKVSRVKAMTRRTITISTYLLMPIMMGIAVCAEPVVRILLTDKWLPAVPYIRIFCFTYAFYPLHTANLSAIKAMGRSDIFLKLEIVKKIIGVAAILSTMRISVMAMAYSLVATSILAQLLNSFPNRALLNYGYGEQLKDMLPQIGLSCLMGLLVYLVSLIPISPWATLAIQIPLGVAIYVFGSMVFHIESFEYILKAIKAFLKKKHDNPVKE
jgi:O-antigen/teichoic acid export membrane protein